MSDVNKITTVLEKGIDHSAGELTEIIVIFPGAWSASCDSTVYVDLGTIKSRFGEFTMAGAA